MTVPSSNVKLTYEDYCLFPEDRNRHEVIAGAHIMTPAPGTRHQIIVGNLFAAFHAFLRESPVGRVLSAPFDVVLSDTDIVQPDLVYVARERFQILTETNALGAPDLLVEVLSPGTRRMDEGLKRKLYERHGVHEYWIVDPEPESITIHGRQGEGFGAPGRRFRQRRDRLTTPLLPGFELFLSEVFRH